MAQHLLILFAAIATAVAVPVWIDDAYPGMIMRIGRSPNMAFGFGSGFSSSIGGISHSTGIGSSFQSGGAQAYGSGISSAGAPNGNVFARGVGITRSEPAPYPMGYQQAIASSFNSGLGRDIVGSAMSSAQNFGNNFGSAISSAQAQNGLQYGSAASRIQNNGLARYQSAISSAQNVRGLGYDSATSAAQSNGLDFASAVSGVENDGNDYRSAVSSAQTRDGLNNYRAAVSAAQNIGGYQGSTAQTIQQRGVNVQNSGASTINGPGVQAAQAHAINTGHFY